VLRLLNNNNEFIVDGIVITEVEAGVTANNVEFAEFDIETRNIYTRYLDGDRKEVESEPVIHTVRVFGDLMDHAFRLNLSSDVRVHGHFRNIDKNNDIKTVVSWHKIIYGHNLESLLKREKNFNDGLKMMLDNSIFGFFNKKR